MSLLAEVVVEEWLNRRGYFTIRGIKLGNDEIDILAIRPLANGKIERRHIEVSASTNPISYFTPLPKSVRKATGRALSAKKRNPEMMAEAVKDWVDKKFRKPNKLMLLNSLGDGDWSKEFVIHKVKYPAEIELVRSYGIKILCLSDIVKELRAGKTPIKAASGADLLELMSLTAADNQVVIEVIEAATQTNCDIAAQPNKGTEPTASKVRCAPASGPG
jgi:hypothetical protein